MNDLGICILAIAKSAGILLLYSGIALIIVLMIIGVIVISWKMKNCRRV